MRFSLRKTLALVALAALIAGAAVVGHSVRAVAQQQYYQADTIIVSPPSGFVDIVGGPQYEQFRMTSGTFVVNGVTAVTVVAPNVTATSQIFFSLKTVGGTVGAIPAMQTITPGTGFTVLGTASDSSTYNFLILG